MLNRLEDIFPALRGKQYKVVAQPDPTYNCLAWAAGVKDAWWWPSGDPRQVYWPSGVPHEETVQAVEALFAAIGYSRCDNDRCEPGLEKIAVFADNMGTPTHAARQLPNGRWTSKLGQLECIEHELHDLEGAAYGKVILVVMMRPTIERLPG